MLYPNVRFKIDPDKDYIVLQGFMRDAKFDGGQNLDMAVFKKHPYIKKILKSGDVNEKLIKEYLNEYFNRYAPQIKNNIKAYEEAWRAKQEDFFHLVDGIFKNRSWPDGEYIAYATIWGMFPRSIINKTFQIPAIYDNKAYVNVIIAHEMLHFIFYDFLFEKHPELNNNEENFLTWNISEIFNAVVQNSANWLEVFSIKTQTYDEHIDVEIELRKKYQKVTNINLENITEEIIKISRNL